MCSPPGVQAYDLVAGILKFLHRTGHVGHARLSRQIPSPGNQDLLFTFSHAFRRRAFHQESAFLGLGMCHKERLRRRNALGRPASYCFQTTAVATAARPSERPVKPMWSVVVAETETGAPKISLSTRSASSRRGPIFGDCPTS